VRALAGGTKTGLGTGGMATKLQAAELATHSGTEVVIAQGTRPNVILDAAHGVAVGTRFAAQVAEIVSRRRWILSEQALGAVVVDDGAARAVCESKSLLPVGVREVAAEFDRGEVIAVRNEQGKVIARGISRYNSGDAKRIAGKRSDEIGQILGFDYAPMLIHADDMVVLVS
jgi:glutamate 5-kinase